VSCGVFVLQDCAAFFRFVGLCLWLHARQQYHTLPLITLRVWWTFGWRLQTRLLPSSLMPQLFLTVSSAFQEKRRRFSPPSTRAPSGSDTAATDFVRLIDVTVTPRPCTDSTTAEVRPPTVKNLIRCPSCVLTEFACVQRRGWQHLKGNTARSTSTHTFPLLHRLWNSHSFGYSE
jgi:hypothetical protein